MPAIRPETERAGLAIEESMAPGYRGKSFLGLSPGYRGKSFLGLSQILYQLATVLQMAGRTHISHEDGVEYGARNAIREFERAEEDNAKKLCHQPNKFVSSLVERNQENQQPSVGSFDVPEEEVCLLLTDERSCSVLYEIAMIIKLNLISLRLISNYN